MVQLARATQSQGLDVLPNRSQAGGLIAALLNGNTVAPITPQQYEQDIHVQYSCCKHKSIGFPNSGKCRLRAGYLDGTTTPPVKLPTVYNAFSMGQCAKTSSSSTSFGRREGDDAGVCGRAVPAIGRQLGSFPPGH